MDTTNATNETDDGSRNRRWLWHALLVLLVTVSVARSPGSFLVTYLVLLPIVAIAFYLVLRWMKARGIGEESEDRHNLQG